MKISIYNKAWTKKEDISLEKKIFWLVPNLGLMKRLFILQRANARYNLAKTLTKWEVKWWWRKPYRQKWTWRARQWSITNPHYIWWWVAHWPRWNRNFSKMMPKKMRRNALFSFLSQKVTEKNIIWLENFNWTKTSELNKLIAKLPVDRNILIAVSSKEESKNISLAASNLKNVKVILVNYLNPIDLMKYKTLCFYWNSVETLKQTFLK
jgi:large subunit ribosomal protein L4